MSGLADGVVRRSGAGREKLASSPWAESKGGRAPAQKQPGQAIRCKSALVVPPRLRAFRFYPSREMQIWDGRVASVYQVQMSSS